MSTSENREANPTDEKAVAAPESEDDPVVATGEAPAADGVPVVPATDELPGRDDEAPTAGAGSADTAPGDEADAEPATDVAGTPVSEPVADGAAVEEAAQDAAQAPEHAESSVGNGVGAGANWVSTSAPPWQRTGASASSASPSAPSASGSSSASSASSAAASKFDPPTVTLRLDQAAEPDGTVKPAQDDSRKRFSGTYGFSAGVGPARSDAPNRYGHPVSQSTGGQTRPGVGQDSQPTVRIGGYVHSSSPPPPSPPPQPSAASRVRSTPRIPRRASLQLRYLEPWSVLKISLVLSVAGFLAWMVAVGILYSVLEGMGVWDQLNGTYSDLTSVNQPQSAPLISAAGVFGVATLIGLVNIVLITAMCTVGSFIYNVAADLAGGIEVTLSERD